MKKDNDPVGHSQLVQSIFHFEMIRHKLIDLAGDSEMLCVGIGASWKLGEKKLKSHIQFAWVNFITMARFNEVNITVGYKI